MHESCIRTHEYKLCMQANTHVRMNTNKEVFFDIFSNISIKTHPKYVPTPPKVLGFFKTETTAEPKHLHV